MPWTAFFSGDQCRVDEIGLYTHRRRIAFFQRVWRFCRRHAGSACRQESLVGRVYRCIRWPGHAGGLRYLWRLARALMAADEARNMVDIAPAAKIDVVASASR